MPFFAKAAVWVFWFIMSFAFTFSLLAAISLYLGTTEIDPTFNFVVMNLAGVVGFFGALLSTKKLKEKSDLATHEFTAVPPLLYMPKKVVPFALEATNLFNILCELYHGVVVNGASRKFVAVLDEVCNFAMSKGMTREEFDQGVRDLKRLGYIDVSENRYLNPLKFLAAPGNQDS
ncbi:hypothetical protein M1545_03505 [Patescibacteria group bacterium]|nr:hypothetical protein [Patescibacteria group bacterium]